MKQEHETINALNRLANAITYEHPTAINRPGLDAAGGIVTCLTTAVMGITSGLFHIAEAVSDLADAVRAHNSFDADE